MKKYYISILTAAAVILSSCGGKNDPDPAPVSGNIALEGAGLVDGVIAAGPEGGDFQAKVTSSGEWRVSGISEWVNFSPASGVDGGTLTFSVKPNESTVERTAVFKVFSGDATKTVTIVSKPSYSVALVSDEAVNVGSGAANITVSVATNVPALDIDYGDAADWVSVSDVSDAFGRRIYKFDVARSREFKARKGVITFKAEGVEEKASFTLTQAKRDTVFAVGEQKIIKGLEAMDLTLEIKSNTEYSYSLPAWLSETSSEKGVLDEETGLLTTTVSLHADASMGSRAVTLQFKQGSSVYGSVYIKQQNPNPVFANIPDANLRSTLEDKGWIIGEDTGKCEILEEGLTATSLTIGSTNANNYSAATLVSIEGLESFPALESLTLGSITVKKVDVSAYPALTSLRLINLDNVEEVNTGSRPITDVTNTAGYYTYTNVPKVTIKGEKIENINFSASSYYIGYGYETGLESFDVTGCPALKTLNVDRKTAYSYYSGKSSLKYVYMTAAQIASVTVTKQSSVTLVEP